MHVGLVLPGFVATEGFPAEELRASALHALDRVYPRQGGRGRWWTRARAGVPSATCRGPTRWPRLCGPLLPVAFRRAMSGSGAAVLTTKTGADAADREAGGA